MPDSNAVSNVSNLEQLRILQNILNNVPSMIGYWNNKLYNKFSNNAYAHFFGKTPSEILNRHISELLGQDIYQQNLPFLEKGLQGQAQTFERDIPSPTGEIRHTQAHYIPDVQEGCVVGIFVLVFDVSFVKNAMKEKAQMLEQLSESHKMAALGEMAGGIAHEINSPLTIISVNATLIERALDRNNLDPEKLRQQVSSIKKTTDRISRIVKALLSFSREPSENKTTEISVLSIFEDTLPLCQEKFRAHGIQLEFEPPDEKIMIECRPAEISQILISLLNNAFDAIENCEVKWIRLGITKLDSQVEIYIEDSGPQIPIEIREKIMRPFFTTKEIGRGSGLGLSTSKGLAETHGGKLYLCDNSDNTKFILRISRKN